MNQKKRWLFPAAAALLSIGFVLLGQSGAQFFSALSAAPFEQLALALRSLSLKSQAGNIVAMVLYISLCSWPIFWLLLRLCKGKAKGEDGLLLLLSAGLFAIVYLMINPGLLGVYNQPAGKAALGGGVYSVVVAYGVLRLLRSLKQAGKAGILRLARLLLWVLCVVLAISAAGGSLSQLLGDLKSLHAGNTDRIALGISYLVLGLQCAVNVLVWLLDIWVVFGGMDLLEALEQRQDERTVQAAEKCRQRCMASLRFAVLSCMVLNAVQLLCMHAARQVHVTLMLPLESLILLLGALLFSHLVQEMKRIRDENESFI